MAFSLSDSAPVAIERRGESRPEGSPVRQTVLIKHAIEKALNHLGGWRYLVQMAQSETPSDRAAFMGLVAKLIPREVKAELDIQGGVEVVLRAYVRDTQPQYVEATVVPQPQVGACTPKLELEQRVNETEVRLGESQADTPTYASIEQTAPYRNLAPSLTELEALGPPEGVGGGGTRRSPVKRKGRSTSVSPAPSVSPPENSEPPVEEP